MKKTFSNNIVINNCNLDVPNGEITALIGKNGSGKTTLIRLISGLLKQDSGEILFDSNQQIGVLLGGDGNLYDNLTGYEVISLFANLHGMDKIKKNRRIAELNDVLDFEGFLEKRIGTLSRGMRQKIGFAISLIHDPNILLLDEPSTGLDIETADGVISYIKYTKEIGKTILIVTHNIFEISDLSDNIAFMRNGSISRCIKTADFFKDVARENKSQFILHAMGETQK